MFFTITPALALVAAVAIYVRADSTPTAPSPGDVFIEGESCTIRWNADPTGLWKDMKIELMTGNNIEMTPLATVTTVDGTNPSKNTYSWTCPKVIPHSPVYFYQFSSSSSSNKSWTGRFTITDSASDVVPPSQSTQPDGENIPWGAGALVSGTSSVASAVPSAIPSVLSVGLAPSGPSLASETSDPSVGPSMSAMPVNEATTEANGALTMLSVPIVLFETALALGVTAFGFTVMF